MQTISGINYVFICLALALSLSTQAGADESRAQFRAAVEHYQTGQYDQALDILTQLTTSHPNVSRYHHWQGKAYGRLAEQANWFKAVSLAKKTRRSFEKAVALDDTNIEAMQDLRQYYLDAPGFLGGSKEKADALEAEIARLVASE